MPPSRLGGFRTLLAGAAILAPPLCAAPGAAGELVVGFAELHPHTIESDGRIEGFDIDVWNAVQKELGVDSRFEAMPIEDLLPAVESGAADVGLGAISITHEREIVLDFSRPYMRGGLHILAGVGGDHGMLSALGSLASEDVLQPLASIVLIILCCAHLLYFAERGSAGISVRYFPGILEAAWCILATITTVGYGDVTPMRWAGRLVTAFVMIAGIGVFGIVIAELSSAFTMQQLTTSIGNPGDLRGRPVATVAGSTSEDAAKDLGARVRTVARIDDAYGLLRAERVDAVLFDASAVLRYANEAGDRAVAVVGPLLQPQDYGIAFPAGSELREPVNRALLRLQESGELARIRVKWFGPED